MRKCEEVGCDKPATEKIHTPDKQTIHLCKKHAKEWR